MNSTNFNWGDKTINSRSIISRYEELQEEYDDLVEALEEAQLELEKVKRDNEELDADDQCSTSTDEWEDDVEKAQEALDDFNTSYDKDELDTLREVVDQLGYIPSQETLIHEDYFTEYIKNLIDDCYDFPSEFTDGKWPYNHMEMDWDGAADEAKADYTTIEAGGETYYILST
jgi:hypothetical protein